MQRSLDSKTSNKQCRNNMTTNYTKQMPSSEAYSSSASQEISHILWKAKVRMSPPLVPVLNYINSSTQPPFPQSYSLKTHFNSILSHMFPHKNPLCTSHLLQTYHIPRSFHSSLFNHSFLPGTNILLSSLFSNTLRLCFSLSVRDQVSHPCKTNGKITVLT
jgi:hypothetical protein